MRMQLVLATAMLVAAASGWATMSEKREGTTTMRQEAPAVPQPQRGMQDMMRMHEQMMADMKAGRIKLDALTKEMNATSGSARIDAIAAVVNELVRQQNVTHDRMGHMHEHMMSGRGVMGRGDMMPR